MAWSGKPTLTAGVYPTGLEMEAIIDQIDALTGSGFTPFTPSWFASSVAPALGNGTFDAGYRSQGGADLVVYEARLLAGTTTTFGTGFWSFSAPVAASAGSALRSVLTGQALDNSTGLSHPVVGRWFFGGLVLNGASGSSVSATVPFTWANLDELRFTITYEAA